MSSDNLGKLRELLDGVPATAREILRLLLTTPERGVPLLLELEKKHPEDRPKIEAFAAEVQRLQEIQELEDTLKAQRQGVAEDLANLADQREDDMAALLSALDASRIK